MPKTETEKTEDEKPNFVIIHSHPSPGGMPIVTPATGPDDTPPYSTREEIHASSLSAAQKIAKKYEGRPGESRVFSLTETDAPQEEVKP